MKKLLILSLTIFAIGCGKDDDCNCYTFTPLSMDRPVSIKICDIENEAKFYETLKADEGSEKKFLQWQAGSPCD